MMMMMMVCKVTDSCSVKNVESYALTFLKYLMKVLMNHWVKHTLFDNQHLLSWTT